MTMADEMGRLAMEIVTSYEARISSVEQIIEATYELLEGFKSQSEELRVQLREALARVASLRRRDFDAMMRGILCYQEVRQAAVRQTVEAYLREQRERATALRERLANINSERIEDLKEMVAGIQTWQMERELKALLADVRREQEEMTSALRTLLSNNGGAIKVKEFKAALQAIQAHPWPGTQGRGHGGRVMRHPPRGRDRPL